MIRTTALRNVLTYRVLPQTRSRAERRKIIALLSRPIALRRFGRRLQDECEKSATGRKLCADTRLCQERETACKSGGDADWTSWLEEWAAIAERWAKFILDNWDRIYAIIKEVLDLF